MKDFKNVSCHRSKECPHPFSWHWDQISRRSSWKCTAFQILIISCPQEGALWVWLNMSMWMGSGRDSYHTNKVWRILDNVQWSYKHFVFPGETLKMAALPHTHRDFNLKDLNNFWSQRGQEFTQRFSWKSNKISGRSLLKYITYKSPKMAVQFKMANLLLNSQCT